MRATLRRPEAYLPGGLQAKPRVERGARLMERRGFLGRLLGVLAAPAALVAAKRSPKNWRDGACPHCSAVWRVGENVHFERIFPRMGPHITGIQGQVVCHECSRTTSTIYGIRIKADPTRSFERSFRGRLFAHWERFGRPEREV